MRHRGTLVNWKDEQGFGFIRPDDGSAPVFAHVSAFPGKRRPVGNEAVSYEIIVDEQRRPRALNVRYSGELPALPAVPPALAMAGVFALVLAGAWALGRLSWPIPAWYAGLSLAAFVAYALDKSAARAGRQRTPENTLHLLAVLGGWPGAAVAQTLLRHKTVKQPFRRLYWLTILLNGLLFGLFLSSAIRQLLTGG